MAARAGKPSIFVAGRDTVADRISLATPRPATATPRSTTASEAFLTAAVKLSALHTAAFAQSPGDPITALEKAFGSGGGHVSPADFVMGCTALSVVINQMELHAVLEALLLEDRGLPRRHLLDTILAAPVMEEEEEPMPTSPIPSVCEPPPVAPRAPAPAPLPVPAGALGSNAWMAAPEAPRSGLSREQQHQHWTRQSRPAPWATMDMGQAPMFDRSRVRPPDAPPATPNLRQPSAAELAVAAHLAGKGAAGKPALAKASVEGESTHDSLMQVWPLITAPSPRRPPPPPPPYALDGLDRDVELPEAPVPLLPRPTLPTLATPYATLSKAEVLNLEDVDAREQRWRPSSHAIGPTLWSPRGGGAAIEGGRVVPMPVPATEHEEPAGRQAETPRDLGVVPRTTWMDATKPTRGLGAGSCRPKTANGAISQISFG